MSRGGRGGARGGKHAGGLALPPSIELGADLEVDNRPSQLFPALPHPVYTPSPQAFELRAARYQHDFIERAHKGPLYTELNDGITVDNSGKVTREPKPPGNAFEGIGSYTKRHVKMPRTVPHISADMLKSMADRYSIARSMLAKHMNPKKPEPRKRKREADDSDEENVEDELRADLDTNINAGDEDMDNDDNKSDEEEEPAEEAEEEDDEEDEDDYNAEKYFSGGEDDYDVGDDAADDYDHGDI
ncbi:hypothetical protein K402DRAFT_392878 [Aulographum hederae CBS 113979]|uniref:DNA-directed RNA polymerase III subunit n=1 Tax=Aulographum hederae CBS 113979 TaxID=1176131 RepID=A0A6G1H298_9PEZI|nr:hypothetical protein K402DRAFT_392878 [Aulographum hederae CBS 113979]